MATYQPRLAVCLHEDHDAQGLYAYELNRDPKLRLAELCLSQAESILPRDTRRTIEGRPARAAIIRRRRRIPMFENLPEAVALYQARTACPLIFGLSLEYALTTCVRTRNQLLDAMRQWDDKRARLPLTHTGRRPVLPS